ncbi:MAG TPA: CPBP family intramembrane glutamic endopeptidase [Vicinamibacterales bacterium]|nr:CPBP family intramembrane glutamic endopeptidase [Vicinamibacterales bacterium]
MDPNASPLETIEPGPIQPPLELAPAPDGPWYEDPRTWGAIGQVILVCGIPTQVFLSLVVWAMGVPIMNGPDQSLQFVAIVSFLDTALIAALVRGFLTASGERATDVLLGQRSSWREALIGFSLIPVVLIAVGVVVLSLRTLVPLLHNVPESPLEAFMRTPFDAALFLVVVVIAGGVREEMQRAFILHRFEQRLGGIRVGLVVFSLLFGALHLMQGIDVAIGIGLLGLFWGVLYIRRRSIIAPLVNHAGFNAAQVVQVLVSRAAGL